jgi:HEAT repeat protein
MASKKEKPARGEAGEGPIDTILALIDHPRPERRSAAAIILCELRPEGDDVLEKLREATRRTDDGALRRWAAEAIGAIAPKSIVQDLQPLLKDPDRQVRDAVGRVLASGKGVKPADIAKMLDSSDDKERIAAIAVLGAMGGKEARKRLLAQLKGAPSKIQNAVVDALRAGLLATEGEEAKGALEDIEAILAPSAIVEDPDFAVAAVQLLSYVADEDCALVLLKIAGSKADPEVRSAAIDAIRKVIKGRKADQRILKFLLERIEDVSEASSVVGTAIDTISNLEIPLALEPRVRALATGESPVARRYAIRALGDLDTAPAAKALAKIVESGDPADREAALESARNLASGRAELARLLGRTTDEGRARQVAATLRGIGDGLEQSARTLLEEAVVEARPEIAEIIVEVLKHAGGQSARSVQENLLEKAMRLKKKGQFNDAIAIFKSICHGQSADPEARFQLGVCELKSSKKVISRGPNADPCLSTFSALSKVRDFSIIDRLREESLDPEDLYYLGFSFAERNEAEQALGGDILTLLTEIAPKSKVAKMAKNKLVSMGWEE